MSVTLQSNLSNKFIAPVVNHISLNNGFGLSNKEITCLFTRLIGVGLIGIGLTTVTLAALNIVVWTAGFAAIPCVLVAAGLFWYSTRLDDYENPEELERFRSDAKRMSLEDVVSVYGWNDLFRYGVLSPGLFAQKYRQQLESKNLIETIAFYETSTHHLTQCPSSYEYQIPSLKESAEKWKQETKDKTFEEIIQAYPFDKLETYGIVDAGEMHKIKTLKVEFEKVKKERDEKAALIENDYKRTIATYQSNYDAERAGAERAYQENYAVKELQNLELIYARDRGAVQAEQNRKKIEARERFDRSVAPLTDQGRIPYAKLSPENKVRYDEHKRQLQGIENDADVIGRQHIEQLNAQRNQRLLTLNAEEANAKNARTNRTQEAKRRFDQDVHTHLMHKEERLRPINAAFASCARDITGRYRRS